MDSPTRSWESLSTRVYGNAGRVADVLAANGIAPGQAPVPGTTYLMPK
ncbi:MAG: hypothetical protein R3B13_33705 [Polyangiaceae bacterium]